MTDARLAVMDDGGVNNRILARVEQRTDFRRVEAASIKRRTHLCSPDAKRLLARCFYGFQMNTHFVSAMGRTKLAERDVETIEDTLRAKMEALTAKLNKAIDGAEALLEHNAVTVLATYDTVPMQLEVGVISAISRHYLEAIHKLDQLMPLLQTLEIEEIIAAREASRQRSRHKRRIRDMSSIARSFAAAVRKRMNEIDAGVRSGDGAHRAVPSAQMPVEAGAEHSGSEVAAASPVPPTPTPTPTPGVTDAGDAVSGSADGIRLTEEAAPAK